MRSLIIIAAFALTGCATFSSPPVYGEIPECDRLIPKSLLDDVAGVPIPEGEDGEAWMQAFIGQTGQLDKANERPDAVFHIFKTCLDMHRDELKKAQRGFFGRLFG